MKLSSKNLIWIDLEMTGLDPDNDKIIEIATLVTDKNLEEIIEGPVIAIHHSDAILACMDAWNVKNHTRTGLIERVKQSEIITKNAEALTLDFLRQYVPKGKSPICGNTICQDRRFLYRHMPELEQHFHYRNLDVSAIKIVAQRWYPEVYKGLHKKSKHTALSDIYDSIEELKYYRDHLMRKI